MRQVKGTSREQPGRPICRNRPVEHCDVAAASCHKLSTFDRGEDCKRLVLNCILSCFRFSKRKNFSQPFDVHVGESVHLCSHFHWQVVVFGRHESNKAHPIVIEQHRAKDGRITGHAFAGIFGGGKQFFECRASIVCIALRERGAKIAFCRKVVMDTRAGHTHLFSDFTKAQCVVAVRLHHEPRHTHDSFFSVCGGHQEPSSTNRVLLNGK